MPIEMPPNYKIRKSVYGAKGHHNISAFVADSIIVQSINSKTGYKTRAGSPNSKS